MSRGSHGGGVVKVVSHRLVREQADLAQAVRSGLFFSDPKQLVAHAETLRLRQDGDVLQQQVVVSRLEQEPANDAFAVLGNPGVVALDGVTAVRRSSGRTAGQCARRTSGELPG